MIALPDRSTNRWTYKRKAAVIAGIRADKITFDEACRQYDLSAEEVLGWQRLLDCYGPKALMATRRVRQLRKGSLP